MPPPVVAAMVYVLVLSSIALTHLVKAFTAAEIAAVLAFVAGIYLLIGGGGWRALRHPLRAIVLGAFIGIAGIVVKLVLVLVFDIGGEHASHAGDSPLLIHIHHVFFNAGFLFVLYSLLAAGVYRW